MGDHITESNVFSILEKICENEGSLKISESVLIGISKALADLKQIWGKLGLSQDEQAEKLTEFSQHILDSIDEYCDNVHNALRDSINANVKLSEAIDSLCKEMNLDRTKMHEIVGSEDTIFQLHQKLSTEFNWLLGIKESTCAEMTALRQEEQELIRTMEDIPCLPYDPEKFPTDLDFREINSQLSMLKAEKEIRSRRAAESRLKILHFWDLLGKKPTEAFEKDILSNKMVLSQKNLELLQKLELNLRGKRDDANKELQAKKEEIESLWKRLDYDPLLRESFRKNFGITDCQLAKMNAEIDRLQMKKLQHANHFIDALRTDIENMCQKLLYPPGEIQSILETESFLSPLEHLAKLEEIEKKVLNELNVKKPLLARISNWMQKRSEYLRICNRTEMSERDTNRGAVWLRVPELKRELKDHKLLEVVRSWEALHCQTFHACGEPFLKHFLKEFLPNAGGCTTVKTTVKKVRKQDSRIPKLVCMSERRSLENVRSGNEENTPHGHQDRPAQYKLMESKFSFTGCWKGRSLDEVLKRNPHNYDA